jgi:tetratricopeptide (TPR) repeat protein
MNKQIFLEYLRTFLITIFLVLLTIVIIFVNLQHEVYKEEEEKAKQSKYEQIDYYLIGILIDKTKYAETQTPKDYNINIKLGVLYEVKKDYKSAEEEYKKAINKAPYLEFSPYYKLARMYLALNRIDDAQKIMDELEEKPIKSLIEYKADIYERLGNLYYQNGDYENAITKYKKALLYAKIIKSKYIKELTSSLASSYVYLAQEKVSTMQIEDAIKAFEEALKLVDAPIIKYQLAILLMNKAPNLAYEYLQEVANESPEIINYNQYSKFLSRLADEAKENGDYTQAQLYEYKIKKIKKYFNTNVLSVNDIKIADIKAGFIINEVKEKGNIYLNMRLKNISKHDIESLYLKILFKDENIELGEYFKQIVDKKSIFRAGEYGPVIAVKVLDILPKKEDYLKKNKKIKAEIYLFKTEDSCKLLLKNFDVSVIVQRKPTNKIITFIKKIYRKLVYKFPALLL